MKYTFYILCFLLLVPVAAFSQQAVSVEASVPVQPEGAINNDPLNGQQLPVPEQAIEGNAANPGVNGADVGQNPPVVDANGMPVDSTAVKEADVIKPYVLFDGKSVANLNTDIKSIMFDRAELPGFYKRVFASRKNKAAGLTQTMPTQVLDDAGEPISIVAPSFFLSSILLPDDGNWSIWINKNKIRNFSPNFENLEILRVTKTSIEAQFRDNNLLLMSPNIQSKLLPSDSDEWDYVSQKGDIKVNIARNIVNFSIRLNQSFSVHDMEVFEGFVDSKTVSTGVDATTGEAGGSVESGGQDVDNILQSN